jgi:hypothetical protein
MIRHAMGEAVRPATAAASPHRVELAIVTLVAWVAFVAFTWSSGGVHLSWDALNHHIYLGWIADRTRFDRDFMPAGYQSYQYPYLYWPVYKLAAAGAGAQLAGFVLATLNVLAVPPVYLIARTCIPGRDAAAVVLRLLSVVLAFLTGAVLALFDATSNDLLASIPLIWSIAFALMAADSGGRAYRGRCVAVSGLLAGVAVAFKFSNGPIAILLPLVWWFAESSSGARWTARLMLVMLGSATTLAGVTFAYGFWGWQLWHEFGNPIYPFADELFAPVRAWLGWKA